jgi:hypothetical protein
MQLYHATALQLGFVYLGMEQTKIVRIGIITKFMLENLKIFVGVRQVQGGLYK